MRTLKISLLVFILSITVSAQWEWTNPKPLGNNLKRIFFIDSTTGWIVGSRGYFLKDNGCIRLGSKVFCWGTS